MEATATLSAYEIERNKPVPNRIHGTIQAAITVQLANKYGSKFQFPNELSLDSKPPRTPDICIFPKKKLDIRTVEAKEKEVPLTTIEILSPSQKLSDLTEKIWEIYFPMGVKSAWVVIPELKVIQIILPDNERVLEGKGTLTDPATGIQIEVEKVFEDLV